MVLEGPAQHVRDLPQGIDHVVIDLGSRRAQHLGCEVYGHFFRAVKRDNTVENACHTDHRRDAVSKRFDAFNQDGLRGDLNPNHGGENIKDVFF